MSTSASKFVESNLVPAIPQSSFRFEVGSRITSELSENEYTIQFELGEGAFGKAYACFDRWENKVVLKRIKTLHFTQEVVQRRAIREMEALAIMRSPYVVPILDQFELNGEFCIVSEYCGEPVLKLMEQEDFEPHLWFRPMARCLLQALQFTKMQGFVHCDIHPGNVFLHFIPDSVLPNMHSASKFLLGDFGLARPVGELLEGTTFLDCVCPPEVIDPQEYGPVDHRVDVYQAGLLFLRFLLPKVSSFSRQDIVLGHPQDVALSVGSPLFDAIGKMLRRHVDYRTGSAMQAWDDIRFALPS